MATRDAIDDQRSGRKTLRSGPAAYFAGIVRQIAELDDRHAKGELDDATWARQRAQLKGRLLETARELTTLQETSG